MEKAWDNTPQVPLEVDKLRSLFLYYLNKIYCVNSLFVERLPEIIEHADFRDLKHSVMELMTDAEKQMKRTEGIYGLLNTNYSFENCVNIMGIIEDAFTDIQYHSYDPVVRDMSILYYLQSIQSIEISSFQVLQMMAGKLKNIEIINSLKENFDEAKENRMLLLLITAKYLLN